MPQQETRALRINAVRRGDDGFVAVQRPSEPDEGAGDIDVYCTDAIRLADALCELLPKQAAGRHRFTRSDRAEDIDTDYGMGVPEHSQKHEDERDIREHFDSAVRTMSGYVQVRPYHRSEWKFDDQGTHVLWVDIADDGRYLLQDGYTPAGNRELKTAINQLVVQQVRQIQADRGLPNHSTR